MNGLNAEDHMWDYQGVKIKNKIIGPMIGKCILPDLVGQCTRKKVILDQNENGWQEYFLCDKEGNLNTIKNFSLFHFPSISQITSFWLNTVLVRKAGSMTLFYFSISFM